MSNHLETFDRKDLKVYPHPPIRKNVQTVGIQTGQRVVHVPTGIEAISTQYRTHHKNREAAIWEIMLELEKMDE